MEAALPAGQPQGPANHFLLPVPRYYRIIFSIRTQAKRNERRFSGTERQIRIPTKRVPGLFRNANRQKNRRSPRRDGPSRTRIPASCATSAIRSKAKWGTRINRNCGNRAGELRCFQRAKTTFSYDYRFSISENILFIPFLLTAAR